MTMIYATECDLTHSRSASFMRGRLNDLPENFAALLAEERQKVLPGVMH